MKKVTSPEIGTPNQPDLPRVLVVENDDDTRFVYKELLSLWGYQPVIATDDRKSLMANAEELARAERCHLAIVDMKLTDDFDNDNDKSGLGLIQKLRPAKTIIVSGVGNVADARKSLEKGAIAFVGKEEGYQAVREKLDSEILKICARRKGLSIEPVEMLLHLRKTLLGNSLEKYHDQLEDAFLKLFPDAQRLHLEKMGTSHISSDFLTVPRPRSVILSVREENRQPVIVKLARVHKTEIEIKNYRKYIDEQLYGNFVPVLKGECVLWDIGGVKFSYVGTIDRNFSNFFRTQRINKIKQCLTGFFTSTWNPHYSQTTELEKVSLYELYCKVWEKDWVERINRFQSFQPEEIMGKEKWDRIQAPNPIEWLKDNIICERDVSFVEKTKTAVTHGDLHGDNMLVDANNNIWVVDFERTRDGHILQDFIELESDIINRLPCTENNFHAFLSICFTICEQKEIRGMELTEPVEAEADMSKALLTISHIRSLARECTGISDIRQYLFGLLFNIVFRATITTSNQRRQCQQRALMLASILCHRLDHWGEPWPPPEWLKFV